MEQSEKLRATALIKSKEKRKRGSVVQNEANKFYSSGEARSFIRGIADQLSEEDPELMVEFFSALEIAQAALVSWLIDEKETENSCLRGDSPDTREFQLALGRLKVTVAKLKRLESCNIRQVADKIFSLAVEQRDRLNRPAAAATVGLTPICITVDRERQ